MTLRREGITCGTTHKGLSDTSNFCSLERDFKLKVLEQLNIKKFNSYQTGVENKTDKHINGSKSLLGWVN